MTIKFIMGISLVTLILACILLGMDIYYFIKDRRK